MAHGNVDDDDDDKPRRYDTEIVATAHKKKTTSALLLLHGYYNIKNIKKVLRERKKEFRELELDVNTFTV